MSHVILKVLQCLGLCACQNTKPSLEWYESTLAALTSTRLTRGCGSWANGRCSRSAVASRSRRSGLGLLCALLTFQSFCFVMEDLFALCVLPLKATQCTHAHHHVKARTQQHTANTRGTGGTFSRTVKQVGTGREEGGQTEMGEFEKRWRNREF